MWGLRFGGSVLLYLPKINLFDMIAIVSRSERSEESLTNVRIEGSQTSC